MRGCCDIVYNCFETSNNTSSAPHPPIWRCQHRCSTPQMSSRKHAWLIWP